MKSAGRHRGSGRAVTDPDRDGRSGALIIADAISPFCGIGCVMFALVAAAQFAFDATAGSAASSTLAAGSAVILGAGWLLLRGGRGEAVRRRPLPFGVALAVLVALNPLVYIIGTGITYPATGMLLVIVGVGGLLHDRFWAAAVIVVLDVGWIVCAVAYGLPVPAALFAAQLVKANALAVVLSVVRTRTVRRMEQAREEIHRLATTDALTGLANQRGLLEVAPQLLHDVRGGMLELAVVYLDVDGLKRVNDTHGHPAGDQLIRSVAQVLRRVFRSQDTIARVGGDEFAVLLVGADPSVTGHLVARVHEELRHAGISVSTGTARSVAGSPDADLADLLNAADRGMYASKARPDGPAGRGM